MPLASVVTGLIAVFYMMKDGEISLERVAALLTAMAASWILIKRSARRCWRKANPDAPESAFPLDR